MTKAPKISEVAKRGLTCGVLPKTTGVSYMRFKPGPMGERRVTQEVMKVAVIGGYFQVHSLTRIEDASVDIFSYVVNTWETNGETFTATAGTWTKGRVRFAALS